MSSRRSSREHKNKFIVGDCVETSKGEKCIIRFIGKVEGLSSANLYGIEYIDGTIGEHNGKYKGKKYFIGLPKRCSFIKYNTIRRKAKFYDINQPRKSRSKASTPRSQPRRRPKGSKKRKSLPTKMSAFSSTPNRQRTPNRKRNSLPIKIQNGSPRHNRSEIGRLDRLSERSSNSNSVRSSMQSSPQNNKSKTRLTKRSNSKSRTATRSSSKPVQSQNARNKQRHSEPTTPSIPHRECSRYRHERIHFSQMDSLDLSGLNMSDLLHLDAGDDGDIDDEIAPHRPRTESNHSNHSNLSNLSASRKMASPQIMLSQDSMNEWHLKRNLLIGDIYIGHRYLLKDGRVGISMYVGPLHWIDAGRVSPENEYIGIALEKGEGIDNRFTLCLFRSKSL